MQMPADWNNFNNILCIRLDNLGDVIMTSPAFRAIKRAGNNKKITLLTSRAGAPIAKFIPEIDEVMVFDTPWEKNENQGSTAGILNIVTQLKEKKFDGAIIFTVYSQNPLPTAMLCYMAEISNIAGYCRENPYKLITNWIPEIEPFETIKHEVERQLHLVKNLGFQVTSDEMSLKVSEGGKLSLQQKLKELDIDLHSPFIILHPGVSEIKRQYPVEYFSEAAILISKQFNIPILLTGVESEKHLTEKIAEKVGVNAISLAGKLTLEEFLALIGNAKVVISNNTGPVHIAAALKKSVIVLYAATNPQHTPWKVPSIVLYFDVAKELRSKNVIISMAYDKSFKDIPQFIPPEEILSAAEKFL